MPPSPPAPRGFWRGRPGFTFIEILVGTVILIMGLIPLFLAYSVSTHDTKISIEQVQAINHAANLLEALRAFATSDFKNLTYFPRAMEQRKGGTQEWVAPSADAEGGDQGSGASFLTEHESAKSKKDFDSIAQSNFTEFKRLFFDAKSPVVPEMEPIFHRSFRLIQRNAGYITAIVRVSYEGIDLASTKPAGVRVVELRTVIADPYIFIAPQGLSTAPVAGASPVAGAEAPGSQPMPSDNPNTDVTASAQAPAPPVPYASSDTTPINPPARGGGTP